MNILTESGTVNSLYCELCDFIQFSSYTEFHIHHLTHVRQPSVRLVKFSPNLCAKLERRSYKLNTGVARRSIHFGHVPPLKISLVKQQGTTQFHVLKKEKNSPNLDNYSDFDSTSIGDESKQKAPFGVQSGLADVEGKNLLERFGANISVSRKGKPAIQTLSKIKEGSGNGNENGKRDPEPSLSSVKESTLERLTGIGISISKSESSSEGGNPESTSTGVTISSKLKSIDISQLKKLKDQDVKNDKKVFCKNKILKKLSGRGLVSISPRTQVKGDEKELVTEEEKSKIIAEQGSPKPGVLERLGSGVTITGVKRSKSEDSRDCLDLKNSGNDQSCQVNAGKEENGKVVTNENDTENSERKKFVKTKKLTLNNPKNRLEKRNSQEEPSEERNSVLEESRDKEGDPRATGIHILERLTDNLNNTVGAEKSGQGDNREDSNQKTMEESLLSSNSSEQINPEFNASQGECTNPVLANESHFTSNGNSQGQGQDFTLLMNTPNSNEQDGDNSNYSNLSSHQTDNYVDPNSVTDETNEVTENAVAFASLTSEDDQSQVQGEQPMEQISFWSDIRNTSNNVDQPQQDPLMTPENPVSGGEGMNQNFLHNFLSEHQQPQNNMPSDNMDFIPMDRLAQTQHQQPPYDLNSGDSNTPMEQLSQQVQRIPNPTPQINVISQHHMQAPQPPQLHSGLPVSPQHISPNSYDTLGHMQPPMRPPLYPGFNMFNQNYAPQTPQEMPRPPMLQQRPQVQSRSYQSLAPPRQRPRAPKRTVRLPPTHDMTPKQRRMDPPLQARPQLQNPTAKIPSGITITPPKKTVEANNVADVLASRGITVTPSASRQTNHPPRPQQRNGQSPVLNIGSAISITPSSQSRGNGGFAVPRPRRNAPIVNHHVERPERCTTVDLTLDDEPLQVPRNRAVLGRYPCNQCVKIFTSSVALESHKASHRTAAALPFKCDKCSAQYTTSAHLQQHKLIFHKTKQSAPDLAIPIVDLNHPGAREQLLKCGVYYFLPLAQLQSNNNGYFGMPIIQLDTAKEKAVSNLSTLGAGNIFVLGKMKALVPQPNH